MQPAAIDNERKGSLVSGKTTDTTSSIPVTLNKQEWWGREVGGGGGG